MPKSRTRWYLPARTRKPFAAPPGPGQAPDAPRMVSSIVGCYPVEQPSKTVDGPELARFYRSFVPRVVVLAERCANHVTISAASLEILPRLNRELRQPGHASG